MQTLEAMPGVTQTAFQLSCSVTHQLPDFIEENRQVRPLVMVAEGTCKGKTLALCGAGPSLADYTGSDADHVFATNSALTYLWDQGHRVDGGVAIDQTPAMLGEWPDPPPVTYFLASSCDPALVRHLLANNRRVMFFHSWVGIPNEWDTYNRWPPGVLVGRGFTVLERFIHVGLWMGFDRIDVYGADHAFRSGPEAVGRPAGPWDIAHANGESATEAYINPMVMQHEFDGRVWRTRPDMLMAAVSLARRVRESEGRIRLMGDTLPGALLDKDDEFMDLVCRELAPEERARTIYQPPEEPN